MPNWKKLITSGSTASLSNIFVDNAVTASYFKGDGSALTGVTTEIAETATVSDTFTSTTSKVVTHNFDSKNVLVTVYNDSDQQILPSTTTTTDVNSVTVTFDTATSGRVVVAKGGHIVQGVGTADDSNLLNGQSGSYYLDYNNLANIPADIAVTGSNNFTGNQEITGSVYISGSDFSVTGVEFPGAGEKHLFFTAPFTSVGRNYDGIGIALENTASFGELYQHSLLLYAYDNHEAPNFGTEVNLGTLRAHMLVQASGSNSLANVSVEDNDDGTTTAKIYGDDIQLGAFNGESISIGNASSNIIVSASTLQIHSDITASGHLIPSTTEVYDLGTAAARWRDLYLSGSTIDLGGTLITRDGSGNVEFKDSQTSNLKTLRVEELEIQKGETSVRLKLDDSNNIRFEDSASGASLAPTYYQEAISGASLYYVTHSLDEYYPIVQVYDPTREQVIPKTIISTTTNIVKLEFDSSFTGTVVVKK